MKEKNKRKFGSFNNFVLLCRVKQQRKAIMRIAQIVTATVMAFILFPDSSNAQEYYYGEGDFGELVIKNDSTYSISFYEMPTCSPNIFYDIGYYHRIGDTLFLNSVCKRKYELIECSEQEPLNSNCTSRYIIKHYRVEGERYYQIDEWVGIQNCDDPTEVFLGSNFFYKGDLIVIKYSVYSYRFRIGKELPKRYYKIKILDNDVWQEHVYLEEFPLLIRKNKLIPIDKEKNEECWGNNSFYFPKMKKKKKQNRFKVITMLYRGLIDLPNGYNLPQKPHWVYSIEPHWRE